MPTPLAQPYQAAPSLHGDHGADDSGCIALCGSEPTTDGNEEGSATSTNSPTTTPKPLLRNRVRYIQGIFYILLQCIVWIGAAILTQSVYETSEIDISPFLFTFIGMSILALLLPLRYLMDHKQHYRTKKTKQHPRCRDDNNIHGFMNFNPQESFDTVDMKLSTASDISDYVDIGVYSTKQLAAQKEMKHWNHRKHIWAALLLTPAMFMADWAFNMALLRTSVASATVLVSTQSVFVFGLAVATRLEPFSCLKLVGVLACVVGTTLTAVEDISERNSNAIGGDAMALLAALMYAAYTIKVRIFCPENEELYSMSLLLGYIGLLCFVGLFPLGAYAIWKYFDSLTLYVLSIVVVKGLLDFLVNDYCLIRAIVLTNPTVATVGLGLTIPFAFLADWMLGKGGITSLYGLLGAVAVAIGFVVVNVVPEQDGAAVAPEPRNVKLEPDQQVNYPIAYPADTEVIGHQTIEKL